MNQRIRELIGRHEVEGDFTRVAPTQERLSELQSMLGVVLPEQYVDYLTEYSYGGIGGVQILGMGLTGRALFADVTLSYRKEGLPSNCIVVENCDDWLYCIDCDTGEVIAWSMDGETSLAYSDFDSYLYDRFSDAAENL